MGGNALYHFPACAPPSTGNTSPVTKLVSVRENTASTISETFPHPLDGMEHFQELMCLRLPEPSGKTN